MGTGEAVLSAVSRSLKSDARSTVVVAVLSGTLSAIASYNDHAAPSEMYRRCSPA